ncbi:GFA family protein [Marinobacterium sp. CAU 1594]|nr:GFA family protein [Marinobacterium arenosum]
MGRKLNGSCLCGSVKFEIEGSFDSFFLCHCKHCQKDTGSLHAANLFSESAALTWLQGKEVVKTYQLPNTQHSKSFCRTCGSAVPTYADSLGLVVVPAGSLDSPVDLIPDAKIFVGSKASWATELSDIPSFAKLPE